MLREVRFPLSPQNVDNSVELRGDDWHRMCCYWERVCVG